VLFIVVKVFGWYLKLITLHPATPLSCNNAIHLHNFSEKMIFDEPRDNSYDSLFLGDWSPPLHSEEQAKKLIEAIINSDLNSIQELIENGVDVNQEINERSPLAVAIEEGNLTIAKHLIEAGAYLDWCFGWFDSLLIAAAGSGDLEAVKLLVEAGANLELKDDDGHTALYRAALYEKKAVYDYLFNLTEASDYRDWVDQVIRPNARTIWEGTD
jgi:hypothetical protein